MLKIFPRLPIGEIFLLLLLLAGVRLVIHLHPIAESIIECWRDDINAKKFEKPYYKKIP